MQWKQRGFQGQPCAYQCGGKPRHRPRLDDLSQALQIQPPPMAQNQRDPE